MTSFTPLIQNSIIPPTRVGLVNMVGLSRGCLLKSTKSVSGSLQGARVKQMK